MCNRYRAASVVRIRNLFGFTYVESGPPVEHRYATTGIGPWQQGPFVRAGRDDLDVGQWGLIPWFSPARRPTGKGGRPISTNNARIETIATAPAFKGPWSRGQRCLIPAEDFDEPYWGSGRSVWWRFARADGTPWAIAGLWSQWTDPASGEVVLSYTMLTQNCDGHPVLGLMHKPDPALPEDAQDKRTVIPLEPADWDAWLNGTPEQALALVRVPPCETIAHAAADPAQQVTLPLF
jgi:putative SOS response-associated peptidase YedK